MKTMKKLASLLLALAMIFTLATTAFAAMEGTLENGSITITNAVDGNTYSAYQIMYLDSYDKDNNRYSYKANSAWADWLKTQTEYLTVDDEGYITWTAANDQDTAAAFAKKAQTQLAGKDADKSATAANGEAKLTDLKLGYYLVDTTLGTLCSLDTTNPAVEMEEKNVAPTITKEVKEDSPEGWGDRNDAGIGEDVEYKATITVQKGAINYIMHDTMSEGLTYQSVSAVKIGENTVDDANYTVKNTETCGCTFEVVFDNNYLAGLDVGTQITVYYSAKVNNNAVIADPGNPNKVDLSYGEKANPDHTVEDTTITYVWKMPVYKHTGTGVNKAPLAGAKFSLFTDEACSAEKIVKMNKVGDAYKVAADGTVSVIETDETGAFVIEGLDSGTYYLKETEAPDGYNKLTEPIKVDIDADGNIKKNDQTATQIEVENKTGTELPSTGGMGTTLFYVLGGIMVAAAAVLLVTKKRMAN